MSGGSHCCVDKAEASLLIAHLMHDMQILMWLIAVCLIHVAEIYNELPCLASPPLAYIPDVTAAGLHYSPSLPSPSIESYSLTSGPQAMLIET